MLDRATEITARSRLEDSRVALLLEMGIATSKSIPNNVQTATPVNGLTPTPLNSTSVQRFPRPFWQSLGLKAMRAWWAHHPVHSVLQVARPMLQPYAKKHPGHIVAGGFALGSVLYVLRPWRLLSLSTLAVWGLRGPAPLRKIFGLFRMTQKSMSRNENS
jgi:hypothetical protein